MNYYPINKFKDPDPQMMINDIKLIFNELEDRIGMFHHSYLWYRELGYILFLNHNIVRSKSYLQHLFHYLYELEIFVNYGYHNFIVRIFDKHRKIFKEPNSDGTYNAPYTKEEVLSYAEWGYEYPDRCQIIVCQDKTIIEKKLISQFGYKEIEELVDKYYNRVENIMIDYRKHKGQTIVRPVLSLRKDPY